MYIYIYIYVYIYICIYIYKYIYIYIYVHIYVCPGHVLCTLYAWIHLVRYECMMEIMSKLTTRII